MPPTNSAAAKQALDSYKRTNPDAAISAGESKYGVSGLNSQLTALRSITGNLENSIRSVDPSVTGRTQGSLVTEAQRSKIVNNERAPLMDDYREASQELGDVNSQYERATGLASNYANSLLRDDEQEYNRLFGMYTTALDAEQRAAALAEQKRQFDLSLADSKSARAGSGGGSGLNLGALLGGGGGGAGGGKAADPKAQLMADLQRLLPKDYSTRFNDGYTERLIANLQRAYPELKNQIAKIVYEYRKPFEAKATPKQTGAMRTANAFAGYGY